MSKLGSGDNGEFTFLDIISIMSFCIGLQNLDLNVTQEDAQNLKHQLNSNVQVLLDELHGHLQMQDDKIDRILQILEDKDGTKRNLQ